MYNICAFASIVTNGDQFQLSKAGDCVSVASIGSTRPWESTIQVKSYQIPQRDEINSMGWSGKLIGLHLRNNFTMPHDILLVIVNSHTSSSRRRGKKNPNETLKSKSNYFVLTSGSNPHLCDQRRQYYLFRRRRHESMRTDHGRAAWMYVCTIEILMNLEITKLHLFSA